MSEVCVCVCGKEGQSHQDASHNRCAPAAVRPREVGHKCALCTFAAHASAKISPKSIGRLFPGCS